MGLYAWIGPAIMTSLADLKPVQIKELETSFEAAEKDGNGRGTGKQQRSTKAQQREREAAEANGVAEDVVGTS
jgi:cytoskeleton-associated protein 5